MVKWGELSFAPEPRKKLLFKQKIRNGSFLARRVGDENEFIKVHKVYGPLQGDLATATLVAVSYFRKILVVTLNDCR